MKQRIFFILLASLAVMAGLVSCQKEQAEKRERKPPVLKKMKLNLGFADTKVTYSEVGEGNLRPKWEIGDTIVGQSEDGLVNFTMCVVDLDEWGAVVEGEAPDSCNVCFLYKKGLNEIRSLPIPVSFKIQSGDKRMPAVMLSKGEIRGGKGNFIFRSAGAIIGIDNAKGMPAGSSITRVIVKGNDLSEAMVDRNGSSFVLTPTVKSGDMISTVAIDSVTVGSGDDRKFSRPVFIAVPVGARVSRVALVSGPEYFWYELDSAKVVTANSYLYVKEKTTFIEEIPPDGALPGRFSVGEDKQVFFSRGNLQATYNGGAYTWDFAAHQYDFVGNAPGNTIIDTQGNGNVVDLFGWSTAKTNYGINTSGDNLIYSGDFVDWGIAYCKSKGITDTEFWRTLVGNPSGEEWYYMLGRRKMTGRSPRYTNCTGGIEIEGKTYKGMFIYHDDYLGPEIGTEGAPDTWAGINAAGIAFWPSTGWRDGSAVSFAEDGNGYYWSGTPVEVADTNKRDMRAFYFRFNSGGIDPRDPEGKGLLDFRHFGYPVRLVSDCRK